MEASHSQPEGMKRCSLEGQGTSNHMPHPLLSS